MQKQAVKRGNILAKDDSHSKIILAIVGIVVVFALVVILLPKPEETRIGEPLKVSGGAQTTFNCGYTIAYTLTSGDCTYNGDTGEITCKCPGEGKINVVVYAKGKCQICPNHQNNCPSDYDIYQICKDACERSKPGCLSDADNLDSRHQCKDGSFQIKGQPATYSSAYACEAFKCTCGGGAAAATIADGEQVAVISAESGTSTGSTETYSSTTSPTTTGGY